MPTPFPTADWLASRSAATPERPALFLSGCSPLTYHALHEAVQVCCGQLAALGVGRGDRVAILMGSGPDTAVIIHAALRMEVVLVPLNTRLSAPELAYQVDHAGCTLLLHDADHARQAAALAEPERRVIGWSELAAQPVREPFPPAAIAPDAPFVIVYTSGTTGRPKGTVLTAANVFYSALGSAFRIGVQPDDRWLCVLPLYHVGGLSILIRSCLYGTAIDLHPRFDVAAVDRALREQPVTLISLVPTMLYRLLEGGDPAAWTPSLRLILLGGAAATPQLLARCREAALPVALTYGLSEAASQVATTTPDLTRRKAGTVGRPLLFTVVRVVDEAGVDMPPGTPGEIVVSGPTVMAGYDGDPAATADALRGGWLHTGDLGYLDTDGDLWPVQRRSDLIVSGGENVYPSEVEAVLRRYAAVRDVCVVGLPHPEWGQQVAAAVEARNGQALDPAALLDFARGELAGYKLPRAVRVVDALPRTASGKVERRRVVELFS